MVYHTSYCFSAEVVGNESDDQDRDVGIDDDKVEAEDADDAGEGRQARLPLASSPLVGPKWARRTGSRTRPWNKPNTTVKTNTLIKEYTIGLPIFQRKVDIVLWESSCKGRMEGAK